MSKNYQNDNVFAKILREELPCIKVYEDDHTLAFMDIMPQKTGHTLVIPKVNATTLYDLPDQYCLACLKTVKKVGKAVEKAMSAQGTTIFQLNGSSAGQTVAHIHFHIIPDSLEQAKNHNSHPQNEEALKQAARKIRAQL